MPTPTLSQQWQPIETAPKDGTEILLHGDLVPPCIDAGEKTTVRAYWTDHNGGGWVWHGALASVFTHWQPLTEAGRSLAQSLGDTEGTDG